MLGFREKKFIVFFLSFPFLRILFSGILLVILTPIGCTRGRVRVFACFVSCLIVEVIKCVDDGETVIEVCPLLWWFSRCL